jgi:hypothetical protein
MRTVTITAELAGRESGLVQRSRKLSGDKLAQILVFGWLNHPHATLEQLSQTASALGVQVSPQAIDQRFSPAAALFLERVLVAAVQEMVSSTPPALTAFQHFQAVLVQDSSVVVLPPELQEIWPGCGGIATGGQAALKLQVRLDLKGGGLEGPVLTPGRWHDQRGAKELSPLPQGALTLTDLGYFNLADFEEMAQQGSYFISRLKTGTKVFGEDGAELELPGMLPQLGPGFDLPVEIGSQRRLKVRLVGVKVSPEVAAERRRQLKEWGRKKGRQPSKKRLGLCEWTLLVTNIPPLWAGVEEVLVLARTRWQIELLFKLWKQQGEIDEWRSKNPWRILCEVYAKLVAMIIQHWVLLVSCWSYPDRSLVKGAQIVRSYAIMLATALTGLIQLEVVIAQIARCLASGCRINRRKRRPSTYQLLLALDPNP